MDESRDELVRRGEAAAAAKRYDEAIDLLSAANRGERSAAVERLLVQVRRKAFNALEVTSPSSAWPPPVDDPFPDAEGLPEIDADQLTADLIAGAIVHHGALIVRGLMAPDMANRLVGDLEHTFEVSEADDPGDDQSWFAPADPRMEKRRAFLRNSGALFAADAPRVLFDLLEFLHGAGIADLVGEHFGEPATLSINKFTLRRVAPDAGPTTWHQDGAFLGEGVRALNLWISLTDCGGDIDDTPGLAVVPHRVEELLETDAMVRHAIAHPLVKERFGDEVVRPRVAPGDALFFDGKFLHKTGRRRGMTKPRHAVEWWFFPRSAFPDQYKGLVV